MRWSEHPSRTSDPAQAGPAAPGARRRDPLLALGSPQAFARDQLDLAVRRLADDLAGGADASTRVGHGMEYAESRPYQPGDSLRRLDWRLTALRGRPFTRVHEALRRVNVFLVVDTSASMAVGSLPITKLDAATWLAAALALIAQKRMSPVALVSGGTRGGRSRPSLRRDDLWTAVDALRQPRLREATDISAALLGCDAGTDSTALVVVLSDFHDPGALEAVSRSAERHDIVALHLVDPAERAAPGRGFVDAVEAETGAAFLAGPSTHWPRPEEVRARFLGRRIDYLALPLDGPIIALVRGFLASRGGLTRKAR